MENFKPTEYTLVCVASGHEFNDEGWTLADRECQCPSLVRARYAKKQLEVKGDEYGLYKFADGLPVSHLLKGSAAPVTYRSKGLG
ncbi:MAG: cysteate synthase, partial [Alistipes sp.]|nr:cysteate synthase [Alistipes sp.]